MCSIQFVVGSTNANSEHNSSTSSSRACTSSPLAMCSLHGLHVTMIVLVMVLGLVLVLTYVTMKEWDAFIVNG